MSKLLTLWNCGVLFDGVVRVSDFFQSQTPNLKVNGSVANAITSANLDFHDVTEILLLWHKTNKPGLSHNLEALLHTLPDQ